MKCLSGILTHNRAPDLRLQRSRYGDKIGCIGAARVVIERKPQYTAEPIQRKKRAERLCESTADGGSDLPLPRMFFLSPQILPGKRS